MKLNSENVKTLRSGHTVWRCLINGRNRGVQVREIHLLGKRRNSGKYSVKYIGTWPDGNFLDDLHGHSRVACFTTRREADRYVKEVEDGRREYEVKRRWAFIQLNDDIFDDNIFCYDIDL